MNCLVVKAHPLSESLCSFLTKEIIEILESAGHSLSLEDLYSDKFEPALTEAERMSYYQRLYSKDKIASQVELLYMAEAIVLVFPTWWFSFPAILKGWFDRVWAPGIAFDHADEFGPIKPRLNNLRYMLAVTSLGSPWWVDRFIMRQPVKRIIKSGIVRSCAPACRVQMLSIYNGELLTPAQVDEFTARIERTLKKWPK